MAKNKVEITGINTSKLENFYINFTLKQKVLVFLYFTIYK